jgi:MFS family permease
VLLAATAATATIALVGLGLGGGGVALVAPALLARAGRLADERGRGAAIATMTTFGYLGFVVGPIFIGTLSQAAGLRAAVGSLAGMAIVLALAGAVTLQRGSRGNFAAGEELLRTGRG